MGAELQAGGKGRKVRPSMNVTPLVDVVLVLLIIFMVIAPMMVKQFWLHVPKKETAAKPDQPDEPDDPDRVPIVVTVHGDGTIWINKDQVTLDELPTKLERIFAARDERIMFFDAEDDVPYGEAMKALDAARGGGAVNIAVLTDSVIK
ncbi:MAG: biopolymer transporter ExbD [Kofleriaceae bacterium]|nr:biopolymer transporter ExbD [Kofleriaceae bacterium]MCB9574548.1 biopolymer transporter ExbD [Kofleriaceae bacterium]